MVFDDRYKTFLQVMMHGGAVLDDEAKTMCVKVFDNKAHISGVVSLINDKLSPLAMSLKSGICEITGDKYWSVVSTVHDDLIKMPSEFTPVQRSFLRTVFSELIGSENGCITSTDCLNLANSVDGKFNMGDADRFLKYVVIKKWLHCQSGYIYMGVRSVIELMPYFRATYLDNFQNCCLCKEVIFHGRKCEDCNVMFHMYCLKTYKGDERNIKCPKCKQVLQKE